jgi:alpha,alpha-trehalase
MKTTLTIFINILFLCSSMAQTNSLKERGGTKNYGAPSLAKTKTHPLTPDKIWGKLFVDAQLKRALGDNKTFVDAVPKEEPRVILRKYAAFQKAGDTTTSALKAFIQDNFKVPVTYNPVLPARTNSLKQHLEELWPILTRKADISEKYSSLLPLPYPYVVPGGRFREIYYWDSYFTMLGLAVSNRYDLIENMLDNFKYLINTYGHIPNGNRSYYLSRSQPPYFAMMVGLLQEKKGDQVYKKYAAALQNEYNWWMDGEETLAVNHQYRRVIKLADGTILNRYFDDKPTPREESYYEDVQTGMMYANKDMQAYTHLRAGAESGWDFSSRWFADTMHLSTIETTNIAPVDLNCLLYYYEQMLEKVYSSMQSFTMAKQYHDKAAKRRAALLKYFWNDTENFFFDYHFKKQTTTNKWSLAGMLPLFTEIASKEQANFVQQHLEERFLKDGGLLTTPYHTHQQWDAPNGWAPLQYLAIQGLMNYSYDSLAETIAQRWMKVNEQVFVNTGKMMEKYNVEDIHLESGGGEYPSQDGFGWSNGVYLKLYSMFRNNTYQTNPVKSPE